jgi:carbon-monoxide dehydrogenase small subunit
MDQDVAVTVNGKAHERAVPLRMLLVDFLREDLRLTGTHVGCTYEGRCGACTVTVDGEAVKSCMMLAVQADGRDVTTVEGLEHLSAQDEEWHPIQEAFAEHHGLQCGYCTPGMLMTTFDLLRSQSYDTDARLSDEQIRHGLIGNICRCTGYDHIVNAVRAAEERLHQASEEERAAYFATRNGGGGAS